MMWPQFLLLFLTAGVVAGCDKDACNIGISVGVGIAKTCAAVGGVTCVFTGWSTLGLSCVPYATCKVAAVVDNVGKSACNLCGKDQSQEEFSGGQLRNLTEQVFESEQRLQHGIKETQDLVRERSQAVLDSIKEVDQNIMRLAHQVKDVSIDLAQLIKKGVLQAAYVDDFERFAQFSQRFEDLERGASGLIVNNRDVEEFKEVVNNYFFGAEQTYTNIHTMIVGNSLLGQESIFEIDSGFCSSKDYLLYVLLRLFELDATAKFMDGQPVDSIQTERFKDMLINVEQKHIQTCGCPSGQIPERLNNLQFLVSQPKPKTSAVEFYDQIIADKTISRTDLKKLRVLYKSKPFDFSPSILTAIRPQPIEVLEMIYKLESSDNLNTLPLLENKLVCTEGVKLLVRKNVGNPVDYFDKTFAKYQGGFAANGESWLGLERIHSLTSQRDYKLKIIMTDFDGKKYHAVYDQFKVGPGPDYVLTVEGFNDALSTLGDSMRASGMRFSTRDRDRDGWSGGHCAEDRTGGWWYTHCSLAHLTGQHTNTRSQLDWDKQMSYARGGERGYSRDSWSEAEMLLLPN